MTKTRHNEPLVPNRYEKIFDVRGAKYHSAMQLFPATRDLEFLRAFDQFDTTTVRTVLDIPSGGSYLQKFFPAAKLSAIDFAEGFHNPGSAVKILDIDSFEVPEASYDLAVTLAALHHIENRQEFARKVFFSVKSRGYYCIADVVEHSRIAAFLDGFVGRYNGTGHEGMFLAAHPEDNLFWLPDGKIVEHEIKRCPWKFNNTSDLTLFVRKLFSLFDISDREILQAVDAEVGISRWAEGVQIDWELLYIVLQKS
jgi:SAM-dependent methyltransferase